MEQTKIQKKVRRVKRPDTIARTRDKVSAKATPTLVDERLLKIAPWKRTFIESMRRVPNVTLAYRTAKVSRATAYEHYKQDDMFHALWDEAILECVDTGEGSLYEEGFVGREKVIFRKDGSKVSSERIKDTKAAELWLKANVPEKYREKASGVTLNFEAADEATKKALESGFLVKFAAKMLQKHSIDVESAQIPDQSQ